MDDRELPTEPADEQDSAADEQPPTGPSGGADAPTPIYE